jgi:hypothetical protein
MINKKVFRNTVDLSTYPDLVVIYLGMRANTLRGFCTLLATGPKISSSVAGNPEGLLAHETLTYSIFPLHLGMRQYWRSFDDLELFAKSDPHKQWWSQFLKDPKGVGFWHETYFIGGGFESVYDNIPTPFGFSQFAPVVPASGRMFSARQRLGK